MAPQILTEDDIYRTSTQYRLWSFTQETLASLRETNSQTSAHQLYNAQTSAENQDAFKNGEKNATDKHQTTSALTPLEELTLLNHYTSVLLRIASKHLSLPTPVAATGAVYLKRFYLSNSPLSYPIASIMPTCLFLATKTEHYYVPLSSFAKRWQTELQTGDVIREEGTVTQALRFCLDVRHPFRGLRGALMELRAMADGTGPLVLGSEKTSQEGVQQEMLCLPQRQEEKATQGSEVQNRVSVQEAQARAFQAHDRAKEVLTTSSLLSDACFLYTPSQMMFAALLTADESLTLFYLSTKLPKGDSSSSGTVEAFKDKLMATIRACAQLLSSVTAPDQNDVDKLEERLEKCRESIRAAEFHKGSKRNGVDVSDETDLGAQSAKKRKMREKEESKSTFGGPLTTDS